MQFCTRVVGIVDAVTRVMQFLRIDYNSRKPPPLKEPVTLVGVLKSVDKWFATYVLEPITALFQRSRSVQGPSFANPGGKSVNFCKTSIDPALAHSAAAPCPISSSQTRFTPGE